MTYKPLSNRAFTLWAFIAGLEGLAALLFITSEASEAESAVAFGLSVQRLIIAFSVALLASFFILVACLHFYKRIFWNEKINRKPEGIRFGLAGALILELIVLYLLFCIPDYYFPRLSAYLYRLAPVLAWLALIFAQTLVFLAYFGGVSLKGLKGSGGRGPILVALVIIGLFWGVIAVTRIGLIPDELYWNETGVPVLAGQVWIAIGVTLAAWFFHERIGSTKNHAQVSFLIFIGIWVMAAILWIKTPLRPTFNAPGPYPPSKGFYPFVDAALFDLGAQSAIYGKGLFFGNFVDRGLLSGFLALLHRMFGQNYLVIVGAQSAVFAVFPAMLYLIGEKLHSRSAGIMAATLAILKVSNAITGGRLINTSHPKLMLTEFPTGIVLVIFTLFFVLWLLSGNSKAYYLAGAGASIGIGILLRTNVLFIFLVMVILGPALWRLNWKGAIRDVLLVVFAFFITISPWMWRNQQVAGEPLFFLRRFDQVIEERYQPESYHGPTRLAAISSPKALKTQPATIFEVGNGIVLDLDKYQFVPKHFVHNLITSVLVLPPSPVLDDFRHVIDSYPYWGRMGSSSTEDISLSMGIFLAANFAVLSIGIGQAWKRVKFAALVPLMVFLFYNLANAFARTSGGRYIVPVDWVVYFYYAIGLVEIMRYCLSAMGFRANGFFEKFVSQRTEVGNANWNWKKAGVVILPFFLIVAMLPAIELASPGEIPRETKASLLKQLDEISFFEKSGLARPEVERFLKSPGSLLMSGHGFYPRFYSYEEGEPIIPGQITPYTAREFPRLVFTLLLPNTDRPVVLPIDKPRLYFPDAARVIVGGCQVGQSRVLTSYLNYIDAAFVVILEDPVTVYVRVPDAPLECPLREPVCDNNHSCN